MIITICPNPSVDKFLYLTEFRTNSVNRSLREEAFPGGKGVHVALALKQLRASTKLIAIWGGPTGQWIREECEKKDVQCFGPELSGWTRTCMTLITESGNLETEILEKGPTISSENLNRFFDIITKHSAGADAICVSGSWPPETPDDVYSKLKKVADSRDIPLWADASDDRLKQALQVEPFGIHVNVPEANRFLQAELSPAESALQLLSYCRIAAVTDGANGLYLAKDGKVLHAVCPVENVISTVGSGDCLLAGLIASHAEGKSLTDMAITGTACGAANCIFPDLGLIQHEDVRSLMKNVTCTKVA